MDLQKTDLLSTSTSGGMISAIEIQLRKFRVQLFTKDCSPLVCHLDNHSPLLFLQGRDGIGSLCIFVLNNGHGGLARLLSSLSNFRGHVDGLVFTVKLNECWSLGEPFVPSSALSLFGLCGCGSVGEGADARDLYHQL